MLGNNRMQIQSSNSSNSRILHKSKSPSKDMYTDKWKFYQNKTIDSNSNTESLPMMEEIKEMSRNNLKAKDSKVHNNAKREIMFRGQSINPKLSIKQKLKSRTKGMTLEYSL